MELCGGRHGAKNNEQRFVSDRYGFPASTFIRASQYQIYSTGVGASFVCLR